MTADDQVLIALYNDGLPSPAKRAAALLPDRSPKGLGVRASTLRKRGLIPPGRQFIAGLDERPSITAAPVGSDARPMAVEEAPLRCPGCMKVFFPSDSLPIRATA